MQAAGFGRDPRACLARLAYVEYLHLLVICTCSHEVHAPEIS